MCPDGFDWPLYDMTKEAGGVWTFTIQLEPNAYNYHFNVTHGEETVSVVDPGNPGWHPDAINSQVYGPGPDYEWLAVQDVPHGQLSEQFNFSTFTQTERPYAIYLPPDYDKNQRTYPTLYLSHSAWGNHIDWSTQGLAGNILDNLIAQHKIRPMVVVMTNFNDVYDVYGSVGLLQHSLYRLNHRR
jgi:enterochelin esterase-like enzyme